MRKTFLIKRSKLYSSINYSEALVNNKYLGYELSRKDLPAIKLFSGTVCLFDPYSTVAYKPLLQQFPIGECTPFTLSIHSSQGEKIALAGMKFSDEVATEWKLALFEERDVLKLIDTNEVIGTMISSGLIAFGDYLVARDYAKLVKNNASDIHPLDSVVDKDENIANCFNLDNGNSFAICSSGFGEGIYKAYIGLDNKNNVTNLIVDFEMVEQRKKREESAVVPFEFNMSVEESYQNDPKLSEEENAAAKWSYVIAHEKEVSSLTLFNAYSKRGSARESMGRNELALEDYLKAIELGNMLEKQSSFKFYSWSLYDKAGAIYLSCGKTHEAEQLFKQAKKLGDTFYGGAYVNLIDIYLSKNEYSLALIIANEMAQDRPQDSLAFSKRAEIFIAMGNYAAAIRDFDALIDNFKCADAMLEKADCLLKLDRLDEVLPLLDAYIIDNKPDETYYFLRAQSYYKFKNIGEAYTNLIKAYDCNCEHIQTLSMLIEIDNLTFNNISLLKWTTKYIELRPQDKYGYVVRAYAYSKLKSYQHAAADIVYVIEHISSDNTYYNYLLKALLLSNNYSHAKKCAKNLKKSVAFYSNALGHLFLYKRKYARAIYCFTASCKAEASELFLMDLIDCLIESGQIERAKTALTKFIKLYPDNKRIFVYHAKIMNVASVTIEDYFTISKAYLEKFLGGTSDTVIVSKVETFFKNIK